MHNLPLKLKHNLLEKTAAVFAALKEVLSTFSERHAKILMLGLDGAGKTNVLYKLKLNETVSINHRLQCGVHTAGQERWTGQDPPPVETQLCWLVYVVDNVDHERFMEARDELT